MKQLKLLSTLILSGALVACGGSGTPSKPDLCEDLNVERCGVNSSTSSDVSSSSSSSSVNSNITNTPLPITDDFSATNATEFFSSAYKELATNVSEDLNPAFFYSTSGLESGRMVVGDGKLTIGNARFSIGQTLASEGTHLNPDVAVEDYKVNTTTAGNAETFPTTTTWGELDLSANWKMSFCVEEWEHIGSTVNNQLFMLMVDNNQSAAATSIWGESRVLSTNISNFTAGKRVEVNVPGDVLVDGTVLTSVTDHLGSATSFLQIRLPSSALVTMSNLWIGNQSDTSTEPGADTCSEGTRVPGWNVPLPPVVAEAPVLVAGNGQISVSWTAAARATEYNVAYNTTNTTVGATVISDLTTTEAVITGLTNNVEYFVFVQGVNEGGNGEYSPSASATPAAPLVAPSTPDGLILVAGDQNIEATWNSVASAETYTLAHNLVNDTVDATLIEDIPADALNETVSSTITGLSNGANYYVFVKAINAAGESDFSVADSAIPEAPAGGDVDRTWGFNPLAYQEVEGLFAAPFTDADNNNITTSEEVREADGILIFLNNGTALRYRGTDNRWNFNGHSWSGGSSVLVPAVGEAAPELRAYLGFPIDEGRGVTLTVNYQQSSGGGVASGKIMFIGSDNTVLASKDALSGSDVITYTAEEGHMLTHIKVAYSREGAGGGGVHVGDVVKTYAAALGDLWTAEALALVGSADIAPSGEVTVNEESAVTLTATGGNLSSSAHQIFFAHQEIAESDFMFTARIASITGATEGVGNAYRFGLMVMSDLNPVANYPELAGWADAGFYVSNVGAVTGSRGNMKLDGSRTRSDIDPPFAVGNYVRIEVFDDGVAKRVRRLYSTDGVEFTQENSTNDFKATSETDNWFVGFYAAPGANEITIEFDNISIEPIVAAP